MSQGFQIFDLVFFGLIAVFVLLRLRSVLGTRTGTEKRPEDIIQRRQNGQAGQAETPAKNPVVKLPRREDRPGADADPKLSRALVDISNADPAFDSITFLAGARQAYEIIVTAFAAGDRKTLGEMVGDEVMANFGAAIAAREAARQTMKTTLTAIRQARIVDAALVGSLAEVTVKFVADLVSHTEDVQGAVLSGHPSLAQEAAEQWSFRRDTANDDPNWTLVATAPA